MMIRKMLNIGSDSWVDPHSWSTLQSIPFFVPAVFTRWRHLVSFAVSPDLFTDVQESMIERQNTANEKKPPHGLDDPKI